MPGIRFSNWNVKDDSLPAGRGSTPLRDRILGARGGEEMLGPRTLTPPAALPGATEAGERIAAALAGGQRIAIHGDYDADGISGSIILWSILKTLAPDQDIPIWIPHRIRDGYGISTAGLLKLREDGIDLVVSVDCGITSVDEIKAAKDAGLAVIITDHHEFLRDEAGEMVLPDAAVVVHPRLGGAECYPWLAGAGVAWKVACAIATARCGSVKDSKGLMSAVSEALAFAAIGTIADVVEMLGENRVLAQGGLERMATTSNIGLRALLVECGATGEIDEEFIKFQIAPRINALGRLRSADPVVELFTTKDKGRAKRLAQHLSFINRKRRFRQDRMVREACEMIDTHENPSPSVVVLAHPGWHQGLCGPAASKVAERFNCPVVLLQECPDGIAKGSARSIDGISIHAGLVACEEILDRFGGHAAAAGLSVQTESVDELREGLEAHFKDLDRSESTVEIDCRASLMELGNATVIEKMGKLAPFGPGNPEPRVLVEGVSATKTGWIGSDKTHLKLQFEDAQGRMVEAIWFRAAEERDAIISTLKRGVDLVVEPGLNHFGGFATPQMRVVDVRPAQSTTVEPGAMTGRSVPTRSRPSRAVDA